MIKGAVLHGICVELANAFAAPSLLPSRVFLLAASLRRFATQLAQLRHPLGAINVDNLTAGVIMVGLHLRVLFGEVGVVRIEHLLELRESIVVGLRVRVVLGIDLVDEGLIVDDELLPVQRVDRPIWKFLLEKLSIGALRPLHVAVQMQDHCLLRDLESQEDGGVADRPATQLSAEVALEQQLVPDSPTLEQQLVLDSPTVEQQGFHIILQQREAASILLGHSRVHVHRNKRHVVMGLVEEDVVEGRDGVAAVNLLVEARLLTSLGVVVVDIVTLKARGEDKLPEEVIQRGQPAVIGTPIMVKHRGEEVVVNLVETDWLVRDLLVV